LNHLDVSKVTDMGFMSDWYWFNADISKWCNLMCKLSAQKQRDKSEYLKANNDTIATIVKVEMEELGDDADLNHIDVSRVTDMSNVFRNSKFNGDISKWDVSKVTNMSNMFRMAAFNGDISDWDVFKVTNMERLFYYSNFSGDLSKWNVFNVTEIDEMVLGSEWSR
jgi:surface protein